MPHGDRYFGVKSHPKSYVEEQLMRGERIVYTTTIHPIVFLAPIILAILTFILAFLGVAQDNPEARITLWYFAGVAGFMTIIAITSALIRYYTAEFAVTNKRLFVKDGFIRRASLELLLSKIEGVSVNQGILDRLIGSGTLIVNGIGGSKQSFRSIAGPFTFRQNVNTQIDTNQ